MTSDGGVMLLGATDRKLGLLDATARCIPDPRNPLSIKHAVRDMNRPTRQDEWHRTRVLRLDRILTHGRQHDGAAQRQAGP